MRRRLALGGSALAVLLVTAVFVLGLRHRGEVSSEAVPVFRVSNGRFIRTVWAEGALKSKRSTSITAPRDLPGIGRLAWLAPDGALVRSGEVVARLDPTGIELDLADGKDELEIARLKIRRSRESRQAQGENLDDDASLARREEAYTRDFAPRDARVFSRQEIMDSEIDHDLSEGRLRTAEGRLEVAKEQARTEMEMLRIDLARAEGKVLRAQKALAAVEVRAPHDGIFLVFRGYYGEMLRTGMDVWPGMQIGDIPDPSAMVARVYALDADSAGLKQGCRATLRVDAHPEKSYPGRVERVDPLAKRRAFSLPMEYFEVLVLPDSTDPETMKPGQGVSAHIVLEEIGNTLTVPPQAIFLIEGKSLAFRKEGTRFVPTLVETGARSLSRVQVLKGLKDKDLVALRDPRQPPTLPFLRHSRSGPSVSSPGEIP